MTEDNIKVVNLSWTASTSWDMEGKTDGQQIDDEYSDWTFSEDFWQIKTDYCHAGTRTSSIYFDTSSNPRYGDYNIPVTNQTNKISLEWYMYINGIATGGGVPSYFFIEVWDDDNNYVRANQQIEYYEYYDKNELSIYSQANGVTLGTDYDNELWTKSTWFGVKIECDIPNQQLKIYLDTDNSGTWVLAHTYDISSYSFTGNWTKIRVYCVQHYQKSAWNYGKFYLDDFIYTPLSTVLGNEITGVTQAEFYDEESRVGGGYMAIPVYNNNFSTYYDLQETIFAILDELGNILFTGYFTEPEIKKTLVVLHFKHISGFLEGQSVKRDYKLDSGEIKEFVAV